MPTTAWQRFKKFIDDGVEHTLNSVGPSLPEFVTLVEGRFMVECCVCEKLHELPVDLSEVSEGDKFYCGGSPRCCP